MKKVLIAASAAMIVFLAVFLLWPRASKGPRFDTTYEAVLLDNGFVYYGKVDSVDSEFPTLTDVYYIQSQVDAQTKESKSILIRRGNEWHAPNRTIINKRHIIMIEPVTPGSKVAQLIAALRAKSQ